MNLPVLGFNAGFVFLVLFGLVFAGIGIFFMLVKSGIYTELTGQTIAVKESSPGAGWIISSIFVLIGFGISLLGIIGSYGHEAIIGFGENLTYRFSFLGRTLRRRTVLKNEVEEVDIRGDISSRSVSQSSLRIGSVRVSRERRSRKSRPPEIFVRSDKTILRFGSHLNETSQQWLLAGLRQWASAGK